MSDISQGFALQTLKVGVNTDFLSQWTLRLHVFVKLACFDKIKKDYDKVNCQVLVFLMLPEAL
jgi:hypothetical protein